MKKKEKPAAIYSKISELIQAPSKGKTAASPLTLHEAVRSLRIEKKLSGVDLCRMAGNLDPKVLTAVEKGRIKNPSLKTLESIARGLGVTPSEIFRRAEGYIDTYVYQGSQKGEFAIDFYKKGGIRVISFTPWIRDFFCGKMIIGPKKRVQDRFIRNTAPIYISIMVGQMEVKVSDKVLLLKVGESLFFNGNLMHSFYNPLSRDSVLLMMTAPAFI